MRLKRKSIVGALAFLLTFYPFVIAFRISGLFSCFSALAADSFYYLTVAGNITWAPLFSFDTINPTNGFHPLWQILLKLCFSLIPGLKDNQAAQIIFVCFSGTVCVSLAAAILSTSILKLTRNPTLSLLAVVPGFYYLFAAFTNPGYGSSWSFVNGVESSLSLLFFSILFWYLITRPVYQRGSSALYIVVSILITLLIITRLDDIFLLPALAFPLFRRRRRGSFLRRAFALVTIPCFILIAYCAFNMLYAGSFLPVSGSLKSGFVLRKNVMELIYTILPLPQLGASAWNHWSSLTWRGLQIILPAAAAGFFLYYRAARDKTSSGRWSSILSALCVYVIGKALYNLALVGLWHQGHWYFPISICIFNLLLALALSKAIKRPVVRKLWSQCHFRRSLAARIFVGIGVMTLALVFALQAYHLLLGRSADPILWGRYSISRLAFILFCLGGGAGGLWLGTAILRRRLNSVPLPGSLILTVIFILYLANTMLAGKDNSRYNDRYYRFWKNRADTTAAIKRLSPGKGILSFDDGIIAYSLDIPVMSGLGFNLDPDGIHAIKTGQLLQLAYDRGFRWLTSLTYMPSLPERRGMNIRQSLSQSFWLRGENLDNWTFRLTYIEPGTGCRFIEFAPKPLPDR